jgi:hypothetical protein
LSLEETPTPPIAIEAAEGLKSRYRAATPLAIALSVMAPAKSMSKEKETNSSFSMKVVVRANES